MSSLGFGVERVFVHSLLISNPPFFRETQSGILSLGKTAARCIEGKRLVSGWDKASSPLFGLFSA